MMSMFATSDVCKAAGLTTTVVNNLVRYGGAPAFAGGGMGRARAWDENGLAVFCLSGAIYAAGVDALSAGRLGLAVAAEMMNEGRDFLPDGLKDAEREAATAGAQFTGEMGRFEKWAVIFQTVGESALIAPRTNDIILEIVDRAFGYIGTPKGVSTLSPFTNRTFKARPAFRIKNWGEGREIEIVSFETECAGDIYAPSRLEVEYEDARLAAASVLAVNVSQAVRRGFLALLRGAAGVGGSR